MSTYNDANNGYDSKFAAYTRYMKLAQLDQLRRWAHWRGSQRHDSQGGDFEGQGQQYFDCSFYKIDGTT